MTPEELVNQLLSGIVEKRDNSGGVHVGGLTFLKELALYIEHSDIKFCDCGDCPDSNRGLVIEGLLKTALELEMLQDSYAELSEMYDALHGDWLEEKNGE